MTLQAMTNCIENDKQGVSTRYGFHEARPTHGDAIELPENMLRDMICLLTRTLN